jgi:hypothetical protein
VSFWRIDDRDDDLPHGIAHGVAISAAFWLWLIWLVL